MEDKVADKTNFFDPPVTESKPTKESSVSDKTEKPTKPTDLPTGDSDMFSVWDQETEYRKEKNADNETVDSDDETVEDEDDFGMGEEAAEFAADLATQANQEGMSRLLSWMHDEHDPEQYRAKNEGILKKAWTRFFQALNIKITKEKGVLFANLLTFGWAFGIGIWKVTSRIFSGKFRWPWSKKKEVEEVVEIVKPPTPTQRPVERKPVDITQDQESSFPDPKIKFCKESKKKFEAGTGFPKNPKHPEFDMYLNRSQHAVKTNRDKKLNAEKESTSATT